MSLTVLDKTMLPSHTKNLGKNAVIYAEEIYKIKKMKIKSSVQSQRVQKRIGIFVPSLLLLSGSQDILEYEKGGLILLSPLLCPSRIEFQEAACHGIGLNNDNSD